MKFRKKSIRDKIDAQIDSIADQAKDLVDRAPGLRDQVKERLPDREELKDRRDQLKERMPDRDELWDLLPDRKQLLEMRGELINKLPEGVSERLPESVKPKKKRGKVKKVALLGLVTGAGAAAFAAARRLAGNTPTPSYTQPRPATPPPTKSAAPAKQAAPAKTAAPAKKAAAKKAPAAKKAAPAKKAPPAKKVP